MTATTGPRPTVPPTGTTTYAARASWVGRRALLVLATLVVMLAMVVGITIDPAWGGTARDLGSSQHP